MSGGDEWRVAMQGGSSPRLRKAAKIAKTSTLIRDSGGLDHRMYNLLSRSLSMPSQAMPPCAPPSSPYDGSISGWLMHQGKFRGAWKRAAPPAPPPPRPKACAVLRDA